MKKIIRDNSLMLKKHNNLNEKVRNFCNWLYRYTIASKWGNRIFLVLGIFIMLFYLFLFFFKEPIVNEEVRPEVTNNLIPWEVKDGENFFIAMLERPFNLNITEYGQYRPRYLSFFIQFFEENIFLRLTRAFPIWGNRAPFFPIAMILTVISIMYFIKVVWNKLPMGFSLFIASTVIMFQNYQVATYWRARSAKLFAVSACIFILAFALKYINIELNKKSRMKLFLIFVVFLLMTLDEQVLAVVVMLTAISILFCIINKKINIVAIIYLISSIIYATFHLWWGKALFEHFTGTLAKHGHSISTTLENLNLNIFYQASTILSSTIGKITFLSMSIFGIICIYAFIRISRNNKTKKEKIKIMFIGLCIFALSNVLLAIMIDSHQAIYNLPCLWKSVYPLVSSVILFLGYIYIMANSKFIFDDIKPFIVLIGVIVALVYNIKNINSEYYGAYLIENGGFMSEVTDMEITQDEIITKAVPSESMQFKNNSVIASLNTFFTTENVYNAKIIEGMNSKSNNGINISNKFSCYLVTQKNRKLHMELEIPDYQNYDTISVYVNWIKIADIDVTSNYIIEDFDVMLERYRAGKITIELKSLNNINNEEKITLKELYMK